MTLSVRPAQNEIQMKTEEANLVIEKPLQPEPRGHMYPGSQALRKGERSQLGRQGRRKEKRRKHC